MSTDDDDDEFGELDDDEMVLAAGQAEDYLRPADPAPRSAKRRRLNPPGQQGGGPHSDQEIDESDAFSPAPQQRQSFSGRKHQIRTPAAKVLQEVDIPCGNSFSRGCHSPLSRGTVSCPSRAARSCHQSAVAGANVASEKSRRTRPWTRNPTTSTVEGIQNGQAELLTTKCDCDVDLVELEGLHADAFIFSSSPGKAEQEKASISSHPLPSSSRQGAILSQGTLRQTTLFANTARGQSNVRQATNYNADSPAEADKTPTHHKLNQDNLATWVYPTNLGGIRDYQFNIVRKGLFHNLLVALPTGLGKTFIAATVMLNWFRWTVDSQIVFVAPTKPLVAQQVDACFGIVGIPRSQTSMLTGGVPRAVREEEWSTKRVFFLTPQTLINDLRTGICDPKRIVCAVVDEAHRATGNYAYVEVVKFIRTYNTSFRVLALTATPGSSVEAVQEVIDGLDISRVEIRTEESLDIRQYVHKRNIDTILFDPSEEILTMKDLFSNALRPVLDELNKANAYWVKDPMSLTAFGLQKARGQWMNSEAGRRANPGLKGKMHAIFSLLASLAHSINLLNYHGVGPFYHYLAEFRKGVEDNGDKGGKYRKQINESSDFQTLMTRARGWVNDPEFVGHPKLEYLSQVVMNHFLDADNTTGGSDSERRPNTRIMIFVEFRDSADEIVRLLKRHEPMIKPHVFVGQSSAKGSAGMNQKTQSDVVKKFQDGTYNTLVATCVAEEGLDIGEVDLIICYDSSSSPIRMLQRMGRTGRKRTGNIVLLLMRGKEGDSFMKAKDGYEKMQQMIAEGSRFNFHDDLSPRILPKHIQPEVDKKVIEIPLENSQPELPEPRRRAKASKRPPKKFHMPDGVETGFVKASRLGRRANEDCSNNEDNLVVPEEPSIPVPALEDVLLTSTEDKELNRRYQYVYGGEGIQTVSIPRLDGFPTRQRLIGGTRYVKHSRATQRVIRMLQSMHNMDEDRIARFERNLHEDDRKAALSRPKVASTRSEASFVSVDETEHTTPARSNRRSAPKALQELLDRRRSRNQHRLPSEGEREDEEQDDDMADFVVDDDEEDAEAENPSLPSTAPSSVDAAPAPFYTSPKKIATQGSDIDEELPDVNLLVEKSISKVQSGSLQNIQRKRDASPTAAASRRRNRRAIVTDSDD